MAAAAAVIAKRGYEAATTKAIAERAGYSEALIQTYFKGKEGLLLAVIHREIGVPLDQVAFCQRPLCGTLELKARETLAFIVGILASRAKGLRIVISRVLVGPGFKDGLVGPSSVRALLRQSLRERLARYVSAERLPPKFDVERAAEMLLALGFTLGFLDREIFRTGPAEIKRRMMEYGAIFGRGVIPSTGEEKG